MILSCLIGGIFNHLTGWVLENHEDREEHRDKQQLSVSRSSSGHSFAAESVWVSSISRENRAMEVGSHHNLLT